MNIIMLAAGTSSRMGGTNKITLDFNGIPMVDHSCLQALEFLDLYSRENNQKCSLIVVTGYKMRSTEKALASCREFISKTQGRLTLKTVCNKNYREGQFSSTKVGVAELEDDSPFFISLCDMPLITEDHYSALLPLLEDEDAVRPFVGENPGHPVLLSGKMKDIILNTPTDKSVREVIKNKNVAEPQFSDISWIKDIDTPESYCEILSM